MTVGFAWWQVNVRYGSVVAHMKTVIAPGTRIAGALSGKDDLEIHGTVDGPVHGEALVTIAAGAKIGGDVRGRDVVVAGELSHSVIASAVVRLTATARVTGDIEAPRIAIDEGAVFEGSIRMRKPAAATTTTATAAAVSAAAPAVKATPPVSKAPEPTAGKAPEPTAVKAPEPVAAKPASPMAGSAPNPVTPTPAPAATNAPTEYSRSARGDAPPRPQQQQPRRDVAPAKAVVTQPNQAPQVAPASVVAREIPSLAAPGRKALIRKSS